MNGCGLPLLQRNLERFGTSNEYDAGRSGTEQVVTICHHMVVKKGGTVMTVEYALRLARQWSQGHICTLREGEAKEYHKLVVSLLEKELSQIDPLMPEGEGN